MTTQYTSILKLALPVQGELSGTWGDVVNDNITSMVEQAIAGRAVINSWSTNSHTLTTANGTTSESRCAMLEFTDTGTQLSGAGTVVCPALSKIYIAKNAAGQSVTLKTASGTGILVPNGRTMFLFCDGTNVIEAVTSTTSLQLGTSTTVTAVLDEDNMASNSATSLATQQSIKAYVDAQVGSFDTLAEVLAQGNTTGSNDIDVDAAQKVQFRDSAIYINSSTDGQLDIVADTEIQMAATTIDINGAINASGEIIAASLDISGDIDVDGTTNLDVVDIDGAVDMASTLGVTGVVTANAGVVVDNITIDGTEIDLSSGDLTLDVAGNINLDADGANVYFNDGGTERYRFKLDATPEINVTGGTFTLKNNTSDADILFSGNDSGSIITALTLDMSAAGAANFNAGLSIGGTEFITSARELTNITNLVVDGIDLGGNFVTVASGDLTIDVAGQIILDADNAGSIKLQDGGTFYGQFFESGNSFYIASKVSDGDMIFQGVDGGSVITALTLDMSDAGKATFNSGADFGADTQVTGIMSLYSTHLGAVIGSIGNTANDLNIYSTTSGHNGLRFHVNGILPTDNGGTIIDNDADLGDTSYRFKDLHLSGSIKNTSDITLDAAGVIVLDADNAGVVQLKDAGSHYGSFFTSSDALNIQSNISDGDIIFKGNDGGSGITALTLDMSAAGDATFNNFVTAQRFYVPDNGLFIMGGGGDLKLSSDGTNGLIESITGDLTLDVAGDIILDTDGDDIQFKAGAFHFASITKPANNGVEFRSIASDKDMFFIGNDGGSAITALTLDMSAAGAATFNSTVTSTGLTVSTTYPKLQLNDTQGVDRNFSVGTNNETFTIRNETASSDSLTISNANAATFSSTIAATSADLRNTSSGAETTALSLRNYAAGANTATALNFYPTQSTARFASIVAENTDGNNNIALSFLTSAGDTPSAALTLNQDRTATFSDDVIADAFLPTTSGAYGSNHVGVHSSGVVLNAATSQTGYIMSAGSSVLSFSPTGGVLQLGGLTSANALDDYEEGTWTPQIYYQNATDQGNATNTAQTGYYTKIGRLVTLDFRLIWNITGSPANDNIGVKNLPFVGDSDTFAAGGVAYPINNSTTIPTLLLTRPSDGGTVVLCQSGEMASNLGNEFGAGNAKEIRGIVTYFTDA